MSSASSPTPTESLALVRALAEGRQPFTGVPLEAPDWLLDPRLQAALRLLLAGTHPTTDAPPPTQPARQGKVWPPAEQSDLLDAWADGASIEQLAARHQRSPGAIRARLVRMGVEEQLGESADRSFLQSFLTLALVPQGWHHRALLRVIWTLLLDQTVQETIDQLRVGLQALARHFDLPSDLPPDRRSGYHETLTVAWVRVVAGRIRSVGRSTHFHAFVDTHPDLLDPTYLRRHYSHARAMSEDARSYFLPADREPLPPARDP